MIIYPGDLAKPTFAVCCWIVYQTGRECGSLRPAFCFMRWGDKDDRRYALQVSLWVGGIPRLRAI